MKPAVICHMAVSLDGRTLPSRWHPPGTEAGGLYERLHQELQADAWLVGRTTGEEFARRTQAYPAYAGPALEREPWFAQRDAKGYGVILDARGKIAWGRADIGGDPILVVLSEQVSDAHLAGLRADGVSYLFAGKEKLDLALALEVLNRELGVQRLLLEGGGNTNGTFLREGLIDELSVLIYPALDGGGGAPSLFESGVGAAQPARIEALELLSLQQLEGNVLALRYRIRSTPARA